MIVLKTRTDLDKMRRSGLLVYRILRELEGMVGEGVSTRDLENAAEQMMRDAGARPAFKGYYVEAAKAHYQFVLCTSVNDEIVHGMPSSKRVLKRGDIVKIDTGLELEGYYGDAALTVPVGEVGPEVTRLMQVTREALELAIGQARPGKRLADVCGTVQRHVEDNGFSVVREYVGHGIGTQLHEEPQIPNYIDPKAANPRLRPGMVLAIEPMVNAGAPGARVLKDRWTAVTKDGSYSAHFEHCVAVTDNGPWVLTRP
jgi:methionyl aminopeptidase